MPDDTMTIRERAEAEAARAEAESPDEEEEVAEQEEQPTPGEPEPEPEPEPEQPPQAMTEAQLRKLTDKLANEDERHAKRYAEIMGDDFAQMQPCPRCLVSGFIWPVEVAPLEPEQIMAVDASLGRDAQPDLKDATDAEKCRDCDGWGMVLTGAKNEHGRTKACTACAGQGWVSPAQAGVQLPSPSPVVVAGNGETAGGQTPSMEDAWGRPAGHPHWGQDPRFVGA